ncbi:hypothetical protein MMC16_000465 [Acarospora aff. strigata]|nr:hypothetical protein [Acarospora aff. strigata]
MSNTRVYDFSEAELEEGGAVDLPTAHLGDLNGIHPIFSRLNFARCTDEEYDAIIPTLALCSAYLSESELQVFWQTVLYGRRHPIPNTPDWTEVHRPNPPFTPAHYAAFSQLLTELGCLFSFQFANCTTEFGAEPWGQTQGWNRTAVDPAFTPPGGIEGLCSLITLNPQFLDAALETRRLVRSLPPGATLDSKTASLILRQQFFFAVTTVHELAHAMNNAQRRDRGEPEPFFEGQRRAEMGYAWEQFVHGGRMSQVHQSRGSDCGLVFCTWPPGPEVIEVIGPFGKATGYGWNRRASRRVWNTDYLIPMSHIQKLHTRAFWQGDFRRWGMLSLQIPKTIGLRWGNSSRIARYGAVGQPGGHSGAESVSGGSSRSWSADAEGRVRRTFP